MFGKSKNKLLQEQIQTTQEELKTTKSQLKDMRSMFMSYLQHNETNGYILHVSPNGEILNTTGDVYSVLGYSPEQLQGKRLSEITHNEDKKKVQDSLCRELQYKGVIRRTSLSRGVRVVKSFACIIKNDASIIFTEYDITDIIGNAKQNVFYIINCLPFMCYIRDSKGTICLVNEKFANACNKECESFESRDKISGHILYKTLYSNDLEIHNTNECYEFDIEWPDGVSRNTICESIPISSLNNGNFYNYKQPLYLHIIKDIEKVNEHNTDSTYGAHFRCSYVNNEFTITYSTHNFSDILGKNDIVGNIHKDDLEMFYYSLNKYTKSAHPWRWQGRVHVDKQIKRINIIAWPINQSNTEEMLGMVQDLTNDTYEKKVNMLLMRHVTDVVALHSFKDDIKPEVTTFSHSIKELLGYDCIQNDDFWKLHPDDSSMIHSVLVNMKKGIADESSYRIKHHDNYWVKVKTHFIPFDNEFVTITHKLN